MTNAKKRISKTKITDKKQLKHYFSAKSPIPSFIFHELPDNTGISLIKKKINNELMNKHPDYSAIDRLFIIVNPNKTFSYNYSYESVQMIINRNNTFLDEDNITKVIIVTHHTWIEKNIKKQNIAILFFEK